MGALKKLTLFSLFLGNLSLNAQIQKSSWLMGGSMSLSGNKDYSSFTFNPNAAYFFTNKLALGGAFDASQWHNKNNNTNSSSMAVSIMGRYYFTPSNKEKATIKLPVFAQGNIGLVAGSGVIFSSLGVGCDLFLTNSTALEISGGINTDNTDFSNLYAMVGFQIFLPPSVFKKKAE